MDKNDIIKFEQFKRQLLVFLRVMNSGKVNFVDNLKIENIATETTNTTVNSNHVEITPPEFECTDNFDGSDTKDKTTGGKINNRNLSNHNVYVNVRKISFNMFSPIYDMKTESKNKMMQDNNFLKAILTIKLISKVFTCFYDLYKGIY